MSATLLLLLCIFGAGTIDTIETPTMHMEGIPGGSAIYSAISAAYFTKPRIVAVLGTDFPSQYTSLLSKIADTGGLSTKIGRSFHYAARYENGFRTRIDLRGEANVARDYKPQIPDYYKNSRFVYLANADPEQQRMVLEQFDSPHFSMFDTMSFWISSKMDQIVRLAGNVDAMVINEHEARLLADKENMIECVTTIFEWGPKYVIVKKGEHGSILFHKDGTTSTIFPLPGFPLKAVVDPTGAGDSFAGAVMGKLASDNVQITPKSVRNACIYGNVMGSFVTSDYGLGGLLPLDHAQIEKRINAYSGMIYGTTN